MATPATHRWLPSTARVIVLDGFGTVPRGTLPAPVQKLSWPVKDPSDVLDYVFDLSEALSGNEGDTIASLDIQIAPSAVGDLTLDSASADGDQAILWFSHGVSGTSYAVTITVGTNGGRVIARTVMLPVMALASPPVPAAALTDQTGAPLTDQTGAAVTVA